MVLRVRRWLCFTWYSPPGHSKEFVPAECDVDGHLVDLSLVREAIVAIVRQELQTVVVGEHRITEAQVAPL